MPIGQGVGAVVPAAHVYPLGHKPVAVNPNTYVFVYPFLALEPNGQKKVASHGPSDVVFPPRQYLPGGHSTQASISTAF